MAGLIREGLTGVIETVASGGVRVPASGRYPQMGCMMTTETMAAAGPGRGGRMSRQRKRDAALRLLRGEDLETVSRALGATAATLSSWHDAFLAGGEASLATRRSDGEALESERLKARLGEMLLERELLEAATPEGDRPLARPRSRQ
jgi:transposase-like protein